MDPDPLAMESGSLARSLAVDPSADLDLDLDFDLDLDLDLDQTLALT
jgi:hypothetical protein